MLAERLKAVGFDASSEKTEVEDVPVSMGTTLVGLKYDGGVVLAADSRTSSIPVVSSAYARKINRVSDNIYVCRAGRASHTMYVGRLLKNLMEQHQVEMSGSGTSSLAIPSVKSAASVARIICYNNRDVLLSSLLIGGVDPVDGPQLYNIGQGGALFTRNIITCGSGGTYISGLADSLYKSNLSKDEAIKLVTLLVNHAMMRDNGSGGIIRYVVIDQQDGTSEHFVSSANLQKLETKMAHSAC
ncbi:proteasome subunit beta type [Gregarina niphandrodes]|uniref:proteasome endopeptidase complex n=1 Tax=Gregarina niphandrodes TaxID=110365 RepID=A0A023B4G7_GRENI|nr:proteasome subunit beta type [Gregarina niphandrodes]EZG56724.1 proteasome subunit beta type [Gregarina niphandrodes]|eukprot:XP_011131192.1 proteasome subunit beta type [Gregarina niphandrodes]